MPSRVPSSTGVLFQIIRFHFFRILRDGIGEVPGLGSLGKRHLAGLEFCLNQGNRVSGEGLVSDLVPAGRSKDVTGTLKHALPLRSITNVGFKGRF